MKLYLSSYKIGNNPELLKDLLPNNPRVIYMSNAMDFGEPRRRKRHEDWDIKELQDIGLNPKRLDLKQYFGKEAELHDTLGNIDLMYCSGGNVFDLRIAMKLSGLDDYLTSHSKAKQVWAGYSAAGCVLAPTLKSCAIIDDPDLKTYGDYDTIWEGLSLTNYVFMPHFDSDHNESEDTNKEIQYCIDHDILYRAVRDGDVIIHD